MTDEILDLVRGRGVVDRDRGRPEEGDRDVGHVELGPVAHHEDDPVAPADAQLLEARGEAGGPLGVVGPGPVPPRVAVLPAQGDGVRAVPDGFGEPRGNGLSPDLAGQLLARHSAHNSPLSLSGTIRSR